MFYKNVTFVGGLRFNYGMISKMNSQFESAMEKIIKQEGGSPLEFHNISEVDFFRNMKQFLIFIATTLCFFNSSQSSLKKTSSAFFNASFFIVSRESM